jgi:DNA primase catalytic core
MPRIPEEEIERVKRSVDLAALVRSRGVELRRHGAKDLVGRCPFHPDARPSFVVSPHKGLFHCLGCDAAGSVIDLVMKLDGLDFRAAVDKLRPGPRSGGALRARRAPERRVAAGPATPSAPGGVPPQKANLLLERVVELYARSFAEVPDGRAYLERRGIVDAGLLSRHRVGYAAGNLNDLLPRDGRLKEELKALGVLLDNGRERFAGCVVFPVYDADGNLTTLYGRFTGEGPKRHLFLPERSTGLWNAAAVKTCAEIILVESVIDALSVMVAGHANVLAIQGTHGMSDRDAASLKPQGVQRVTLLLDGDEAGGKAAAQLRPRLEALGLTVTVPALPAGHDPNSYLVAHGAGKLAGLLLSAARTDSGRKPAPAALSAADAGPGSSAGRAVGGPTPPRDSLAVTYGLRRYELRGLEKGLRRLKATLRVEHAGKLHVDTLDFYSARSRRLLAQDLCRVFDETPETIEADLDKLLRHCESLPERATAEAGPEGRPAEALLSPKERAEAEAFGRREGLFAEILADYEACGLVGETANKLLCYLAMTSRKMEDPLSVLILSSSGAGKTALQDTAVNFCPPEDLVKLTSLSGKALFYKEQLSLRHKALALEEGAGAEEATYAIRNLITARELVIESAIKDPASGKITTMTNKVEGPTAVFVTTTDPDTDPETRSRFFVTSIDESREQTRAILSFQRRRHTLDGLSDQTETEGILRKHRNFQRLLRPLKVVNPYAERLRYGDDRLQGRRDQPKYLNLIKAVAFLRQMRKPVRTSPRGAEYVEADLDDLRLANDLANEILGRSLDELSAPGRQLLLQTEAMVEARVKEKRDAPADPHEPPRACVSFTRREVREFTGWANARVHRYLKELADFEYVLVDSGRNGLSYRYRLAWDGQGKDGRRFVLGLTPVGELREPPSTREPSRTFSDPLTPFSLPFQPLESERSG